MSSEAMISKANAINGVSLMITKLSNLQDAIRDFDRLRLQGARFQGADDEEYQEYAADMDGIREMACGVAGEAIAAELEDRTPLDELCKIGGRAGEGDLTELQLQAVSVGLERALLRKQSELQKLLFDE
jgi:hypothetical protein